jgi:predicted aconitase with swiveling domain
MTILKGRPYVGGKARGKALVTRMPMNFTASFSSPVNILPGRRSEIRDRHHDLFGKRIKGSVLVFPAAIGSTLTGMVLLDRMYEAIAPCALVVQNADPLLVSGSILANVWFNKGVPVVEYKPADLFDKIRTGEMVEVDGETGEVCIR